MALDIQSQPEQSALEGVLRHHLQLEPASDQSTSMIASVGAAHICYFTATDSDQDTVTIELQKRKTNNHKRTVSQPPMKFATQVNMYYVLLARANYELLLLVSG